MKVCLYNNKGGCGKTTLACAIAFRAMEQNMPMVLIDADKQMNSMKWISNDNYMGEESYEKGSIRMTTNLDELNRYTGLTVVDAPPDYNFIENIDSVDVWIIPVKGRFSLDGAVNVITQLKQAGRGNERVVFVSNMADPQTVIGQKQINEAKTIGVELFKFVISKHLSFDKAEDMCCSVWSVPYSMRASAVQAIQLFADWALRGCPDRATYGETDIDVKLLKRLSKYEV